LLPPRFNHVTSDNVARQYMYRYHQTLCTCIAFVGLGINSLGPIVDISVMRLSASRCHFLQCPLEIGSASAEGRDGGGEWMHSKGANSMTASGLISRNNLVGTGRAISVVFGINRIGNKQSHLVGPVQDQFFSYGRLAFFERLK